MMRAFGAERHGAGRRRRVVGARAVASLGVGAVVLTGLTAVTSGPAAAAPTGPPPVLSTPICAGYSGLNNVNPYAAVKTGTFTPGNRTAYKVASMPSSVTTAWGTAAAVKVNWAANPYQDSSWQSWLHSLKWLGALPLTGGGRTIPNGSGGNRVPTTDERWDALALALGATQNYLATYPKVATAPNAAQISSFAHRTQFLACLAESLGPANTPVWLTTAARAHAAYLAKSAHYSAFPNQAMDQDLGVLSVGCAVGPGSYRDLAVARLGKLVNSSIGADGVPLEQAPGYSAYVHTLWGKVLGVYAGCGLPANGAISTRMAAIPTFLAHATQPDGRLTQLGDTTAAATPSLPGSEYAASLGATGTAPAERVKVFSPSGFIFGRSSWYPFGSSSFYSLRFGPPVTNHGHYDRTAVTWIVNGQDRLVDSGHVGYSNTALRTLLKAPEAHNLMTAGQYRGFRIAGAAPIPAKASTLVSSSQSATADSFLIDAQTYGYYTKAGPRYTTQRRAVLVARDPDLLVTLDSTWGAPKPVAWTQHWHLPVGWTAAIVSRDRVQASAGSARTTLLRIPLSAGSSPARLAASSQAPQLNVLKKNVDVQFPSAGRSTGLITVVAPVASSQVTVRLSGRTLTVVSAGTEVVVQISRDGTLTRVS